MNSRPSDTSHIATATRRALAFALVPALLATLFAMTGPLYAAEDAGIRSVFAHGAGNRALAMGSAFGAIADDPSAPIWNPGGLGWLERPSFYATHTDLIGMGFGEQFGSIVLPSWRLGVFSLTVRHFGVDGIEERDDRNVLLGDDLSDSEFEFDLGYGYRLGPAWSVGGAVKLQRQQLAGYGDSGFGLDMGVLVKPVLAVGRSGQLANNLTLGLAIRNVIQPTLRLDQDSVSDPTGIRAGLAWRSPPTRMGNWLVALDMEKTSEMSARWYGGLEWRIVSQLALRGGTRAGELTAGLEASWRGIAFDYAFTDNPIEPVHRMGLKITFGPTTDEQRQAALEEQERALQERLAVAFASEDRQRVDDLLREARQALVAWRYDDVLAVTATVAVLDPDEAAIESLEAAAYRGKAYQLAEEKNYAAASVNFSRCLAIDPADTSAARGLAMVRAASERSAVRSAEITQLFTAALAAYSAEDYVAARNGFTEVLEQLPGDTEAEAMLRYTEQTMRLQANSWAEQVILLAETGDLSQAQALLDDARRLDSASPEVARAEAALAATRLPQLVPAPLESTDPAFSNAAVSSVALVATEGRQKPASGQRPAMSAQRQTEV